MQFIEKNVVSVRAAIYHLRHEPDGPEFILLPMLHIGTKEYYAQVRQRLEHCDAIITEGIKSKHVNLLTRSYLIVKKIRRLNLVTQREGLDLAPLHHKLINADMTGAAFDAHWARLPFRTRALLQLMLPFYVIYLFFLGTRTLLAENIALDDLPSRNELLSHDESLDELEALLITQRDLWLLRQVEALHAANKPEQKVIGILYGATHMRSVTALLLKKLRYRVIEAEWLTVFEL